MPKMKSNRAAAKRFKRSGSGKLKRNKATAGHFLTKKTAKRKRKLRQSALVSKSDRKRVERLLPE
jgi:large subunit ribosomal protein L35